MAWQFVAATTYASSALVASGGTATLAPPAGYLPGDLLVFYAANGVGGTIALNSTSGVAWTPGPTHTNSGDCTHSSWYKISSGVEPATYTMTNGTSSNLCGACLLYRYTSTPVTVANAAPLKGSTTSNTSSGYVATSTPVPSVPGTPLTATDLELVSYGSGANNTTGTGMTFTYPTTGWTSRVAVRSTGTGTGAWVTSLAVLEAVGGATLATASVSGDTSSWVTLAQAFKESLVESQFMPFFL